MQEDRQLTLALTPRGSILVSLLFEGVGVLSCGCEYQVRGWVFEGVGVLSCGCEYQVRGEGVMGGSKVKGDAEGG